MRKYWLADSKRRCNVDLTSYAPEIKAAVHDAMPSAVVEVTSLYYTVSPSPTLSQAIKIGRKLSSSQVLGEYCISIPKLVYSEEIEEKHRKGDEPEHETNDAGGHH